MKRTLLALLVVLSALALGSWGMAPAQAGQTGKPLDSGIVVTVDAGAQYRPGELVEIHLFVTDNGSLVAPTFPDGFPHVHPPNLEEVNLIALDTPEQFGHVGAYRTSIAAPEAPGLYAIHAAVVVDGVMAFGFGSFQVVEESAGSAAASQAMIWALAAFGVSLVVLVVAIVILVRQRPG